MALFGRACLRSIRSRSIVVSSSCLPVSSQTNGLFALDARPGFDAPAGFRRHFAENVGFFKGLANKATDYVENKKEVKQQEQFKDMIQTLLSIDKLNLASFAKMNKESAEKAGALGWKSKLPWLRKDETLASFKRMVQILESFTPAEYKGMDIPVSTRGRIAKQLEIPISEVDNVANIYNQSKMMHSWLAQQKKRKGRIPENQTQFEALMKAHPPKLGKQNKERMMKIAQEQRKFKNRKGF